MKKTKAQLEAERVEKEHRAWLRKQHSRPRTAVPAEYGETIYVLTKPFERITKDKKINVVSCLPKGGAGGMLVIEYETRYGGHGRLELLDLGPMPSM